MHMSDSKESQIHIQQIHADRHAGGRILTGVRIHNQTEEPHSLNRQPKSQKCSKSKKRLPPFHSQAKSNSGRGSPQKSISITFSLYVHLRWTMLGPLSSSSSFLIHISSNVLSDDKMDPPIHTEYFRSGGAMILMVIESGANAFTSFCTRSGMP